MWQAEVDQGPEDLGGFQIFFVMNKEAFSFKQKDMVFFSIYLSFIYSHTIKFLHISLRHEDCA